MHDLSNRSVTETWIQKKKTNSFYVCMRLFFRQYDKETFGKNEMETGFSQWSHVARRANGNGTLLRTGWCVWAVARGGNPALITEHHSVFFYLAENCNGNQATRIRALPIVSVFHFRRDFICLSVRQLNSHITYFMPFQPQLQSE